MSDWNTPGGKARAATATRGSAGQFMPENAGYAQHRTATIQRLREETDSILAKAYADGCVDCGEKDVLVLQFDHVRGERTASPLAMRQSPASMREEIAKCDVRCANCHQRETRRRGQQRNSGPKGPRTSTSKNEVSSSSTHKPRNVLRRLTIRELPNQTIWWNALAIQYPLVNLHAELLKAMDWHRADEVKSPKLFFRNWIERASLTAPIPIRSRVLVHPSVEEQLARLKAR